MIKKIVCAALTTALLISSAVGVMAAEYSTTTKYSGDGIEVSSTVSDVTVGDTLTYLAWEDADGNGEMADGEVVYIDQIVAEETTETFTYAAKTAAINAKVLYGGKTAEGSAMLVNDDTVIPGMITVKVGAVTIAEGCASDKGEDYVKVAYASGYTPKVLSSVKKGTEEVDGWFAAEDGLWIPKTAFGSDETITLVATEVESELETATTYDVKIYNNTLLVFGKATGHIEDGKYGAEIALDETFTTPLEYADSVTFAAAGRNKDGEFLIELNYGEKTITKDTYYARVYANKTKGKTDSVSNETAE